MSYIEESLSAGEKIESLFRLHWFAWLPMVLWLVLGVVTFGLTWLIALYEYLRLKFTEMGVTNKRVVLKGIDDPMAVKRQIESVSNPVA